MKRSIIAVAVLACLPGVAVADTPLAGDASAGRLNLNLPASERGGGERERRIGLKAFAAMVAESDELIRAQRLEENIADEGIRAAKAIFEPFEFVTFEREGMEVLTSAQDAQRLGVLPGDVFTSNEKRVKAGVQMKTVIGTDLELSYGLSALRDSIQPTKTPIVSPEYKGSLGLKLTQPLLRGAGREAVQAGIDVAGMDKDIARETVRQLTAQRVMDALHAYIFTQRAEARVRFRAEAAATAIAIEREVTQQQAAGLRSAAELAEARSSLALRRAQLAQAQQDLEEQFNALQVFVAGADRDPGKPLDGSLIRPGDSLDNVSDDSANGASARKESGGDDFLAEVFKRRPETRVNEIRIQREGRKIESAREQTRPELNLVLRYGKESLDGSWRPIGDYFTSENPYHTWYVGLNFRVGAYGDEKKQSEFQTAIYKRQQADLALRAIQQRIANEKNVSGNLVAKVEQQVLRQREIVAAQRELLEIEKTLVREGRRSQLDVLKKHLEVSLAAEALADAQAQATRVSYLSSQVDGSLLKRLGLE